MPSGPANVLHNLSQAMLLRDIVAVDATLSSGFVLRFALRDSLTGEPDSLIRAEVLDCLEHLLAAGDLTAGSPSPTRIFLRFQLISQGPDPRIGRAGDVRCEVVYALTLNYPTGDIQTITSPATFYFTQEPPGSGHWKIRETLGFEPCGSGWGRAH